MKISPLFVLSLTAAVLLSSFGHTVQRSLNKTGASNSLTGLRSEHTFSFFPKAPVLSQGLRFTSMSASLALGSMRYNQVVTNSSEKMLQGLRNRAAFKLLASGLSPIPFLAKCECQSHLSYHFGDKTRRSSSTALDLVGETIKFDNHFRFPYTPFWRGYSDLGQAPKTCSLGESNSGLDLNSNDAFESESGLDRDSARRYVLQGHAQGTTFSIIYYATDSLVTSRHVYNLLNEVDGSLSLWKHGSAINRFNRSAKAGTTDKHVLAVTKKSLDISRETNGLFDCTVQPLVQAWGFGSTKQKFVPDSASIQDLLSCVGYKKLKLLKNQLLKTDPCVKIDLNGIAQGYTVDLLAELLESKGISNYLVELGGEIRVKGRRQPDGSRMKIGIESPGSDEFEKSMYQTTISIEDAAVTTSGSYRKFRDNNGKLITHIIDPRTGYPSSTDIISVSVVAKKAITADGYDNALFAMGLKSALEFVEDRPELAAYFIYVDGDGKVKDSASSRFKSLIVPIK